MTLLAVCLAGAVGTGAHYLAAIAAARWLGTDLPYGTFAVKVLGSFAIGLVQVIALTTLVIPETVRLMLTVGLMGGSRRTRRSRTRLSCSPRADRGRTPRSTSSSRPAPACSPAPSGCCWDGPRWGGADARGRGRQRPDRFSLCMMRS